jgi:DNA polymerase V
MLQKLYAENEGLLYQKAGVIVTQLRNENEKQFDLFVDENPKHLSLMKAMDAINGKIGHRKVKLGAQGNLTWNMRQNKLSLKYTTHFDQILTIRCQ